MTYDSTRSDPSEDVAVEDSTFFSTVSVEESASVPTDSGGDLWPACWADDDQLYTANGDGRGFGAGAIDEMDIAVNRVAGTPETGMTGERLAAGDELGPIWGDPERYNRKPTGMLSVGGVLYLAIQDLRKGEHAFDDAPNASISRSDDHGRTWQWTDEPMFTDHRFTTIMFLDFGKDSEHAVPALGPDDGGYAYAFGLDWNWRRSNSGTVQDPVDLYLARVPADAVQDRSAWEFWTGPDDGSGTGPEAGSGTGSHTAADSGDRQTWSRAIERKRPVLHDAQRRYLSTRPELAPVRRGTLPIAQGGVVYNAPLRRFLYTSWSGYGFEFYEAPAPWGPWRRFLHHNFGAVPWYPRNEQDHTPKQGGYGTVAPSKFISSDGQLLWVNSNWWVDAPAPEQNYNFCLRRVRVTPRTPETSSTPDNAPDSQRNLARVGADATPIGTCAHHARWDRLLDGDRGSGEDSFDSRNKRVDFWGITFSKAYRMNRVVYTTGAMFPDGGWFSAYDGGLRVQVRRDGLWTEATGLAITPDYPYDSGAGDFTDYTLCFDPVVADGVRIIGPPGGGAYFTSIAELEVYFDSP